MNRRCVQRVFDATVVTVALLFTDSGYALAEPGMETCEDRYSFFHDNLFRVDADGDGGGGIAMFVGRRGGELWLATPAHVVYATVGNKLSFALRPGLSVRDRAGKTLSACANTAPTNRTGGYDLTFLCVDPRFNTFVHDETSADTLDTDATFVLFGSSTSLETRRRGVRIEKLGQADSSSGATHHITGTEAEPGDSGAAVGNCRGIVGMFLNSDQHMLSLETIRTQAREAEVPWTLSKAEYFAPGATSTVCPTFETGTPHTLVLRSGSGGKELALNGCMSVPHATYEVLAGDPWLSCTPRKLVLSSRSEAQVDLRARCLVRLAGNWQSTEAAS